MDESIELPGDLDRVNEFLRQFSQQYGRRTELERQVEEAIVAPIIETAERLHRKGQHRQPDRGLIYFVEAVGLDRLKIGYTSGKIQARLAVIRTGSPVEIRPLLVLKDKAPQDEAALHRLFRPYRSHHEWYVAAPALVQYIADLCATKGDDQVQWTEHLDWLFKRKLVGSDKS